MIGDLLGSWLLVSLYREHADGRREYTFGQRARGIITYSPDGWMQAILIAEERPSPSTDRPTIAEKAALFDTVVAYAGRYSIDGTTVTHHVGMSWNETWTGIDQVRHLALDGDDLTIRTPPMTSPLDGQASSFVLTWKRG